MPWGKVLQIFSSLAELSILRAKINKFSIIHRLTLVGMVLILNFFNKETSELMSIDGKPFSVCHKNNTIKQNISANLHFCCILALCEYKVTLDGKVANEYY